MRQDIRNIAIIAHVDHGKTTLVDQLLRQSGVFSAHEQVVDCVMDTGDLERERGITILSKNTAVQYGNVKINIVDTPGHADFGGEVERALNMVDGVLLLVDAFEGCMPQTRFVLKKALALKKKAVVVVNKLDRAQARPHAVVDEVIDLFIDLGADDAQLDFPVLFASGRDGYATTDLDLPSADMRPLFDAIVTHVPAPAWDDGPLQMLVSNIDHDEYVGRIGVCRVTRGEIVRGATVALCREGALLKNTKVSTLYQFAGLRRVEVEKATAGDIVAISGIRDIAIGDTVCRVDCVDPLPFEPVDEPTMSMDFLVNDSPFAGREGKYVTSRNLHDRLMRELETNVALRVALTDSTDRFTVSGRGELHLSILIEQMRRQGYEFAVSRPRVIEKTIDGKRCEPMEKLVVDVPEEYAGAVISKVGQRRGELEDMQAVSSSVRLTFRVPSRGLFGYRSELLTDTRGNGVMNQLFDGYAPYAGEIETRLRGSLVAHETGECTAYGAHGTLDRGQLFVSPGEKVYEGMVVGVNNKNEDIVVNVCRKKQMTNMRAAGSDEALRLPPPIRMSLEQCLEFIVDDELVEVTPQSVRMRKTLLTANARAKNFRKE